MRAVVVIPLRVDGQPLESIQFLADGSCYVDVRPERDALGRLIRGGPSVGRHGHWWVEYGLAAHVRCERCGLIAPRGSVTLEEGLHGQTVAHADTGGSEE